MKTFYRCIHYDCGWCYAPPYVNSNDYNGKCNNMEECPAAEQMNVCQAKHRWDEEDEE